MKILFSASEMTPFAKTGGLADVASALPKYLARLGHKVVVVLPRYYNINRANLEFAFSHLRVSMGSLGTLWAGVYRKRLANNLTVYFIDYEEYFGRSNLYTDDRGFAYPDNAQRFIFFSRATLELARRLDFSPDIIHANDWHTAPLPIWLNSSLRNDPFFKNSRSIFTIHNLQHQGIFDASTFEYLELSPKHFNPFELEALGALNLMKGAIYHADKISTVSPSYAKEIQTPQFGFGLQEHIKAHSYKLRGILNGVDYEEWNPATDSYLIANYDIGYMEGKAKCKRDLQARMLLNIREDLPLIGFVGRFASQKGIELIASVMYRLVKLPAQWVFLGSGEKWAEEFFRDIARDFESVGSFIGYSEEFAHKIEAGSDLFLMPSLFEPCGLNQIYSLRYGTLPIVRAVGGLDDTVENFDPSNYSGDGFKFWDATSEALYNTIKWAIDTWHNDKEAIYLMQKEAMSQRFSWEKSAKEYEALYNEALKIEKW